MPTRLKETDVVIIGLGAAGGVAALPLAQAGLDVVGVEAGTWLTKRDFAPDELRNNFRGWPQAAQKANQEIPTHRPTASSPPSPRFAIHPTMNAVGGTTLALLGAELAAESVGLQGRQRDDAPLRRARVFRRAQPSRTGRSASRSSNRTTTRSSTRSACRARPATSRGRSIAAATSSRDARAREYPMPPLRGTGFTDLMAAVGAHARLAPVSRPGRDQFAALPGPLGLHVSRILQPRRLSRRREELDRRHDDSEGAGDRPAEDRDARARHAARGRRQRPRLRRHLRHRRHGVLPAGQESCCSRATPTRTRGCCCCRRRRHFPTGCRTITARSDATTSATRKQPASRRCFPWNTNSWYGLPAQGVAIDDWADDNFDHAGLDFIGGGNLWVYSDRRPIAAASMSTFGKTARSWGAEWKAFIAQNADRTNTSYLQKTTLPYESNYLDLDPEVKDPLGFPVCRITADYQDNERKLAAFMQDKMEEWYRASRRDRDRARAARLDGADDARVRRHADGRQRRDERRRSVGVLARSAEPRRARRVGDGHERRAKSHADRAGARLAHGGTPGEEFQRDREQSARSQSSSFLRGPWHAVSIGPPRPDQQDGRGDDGADPEHLDRRRRAAGKIRKVGGEQEESERRPSPSDRRRRSAWSTACRSRPLPRTSRPRRRRLPAPNSTIPDRSSALPGTTACPAGASQSRAPNG